MQRKRKASPGDLISPHPSPEGGRRGRAPVEKGEIDSLISLHLRTPASQQRGAQSGAGINYLTPLLAPGPRLHIPRGCSRSPSQPLMVPPPKLSLGRRLMAHVVQGLRGWGALSAVKVMGPDAPSSGVDPGAEGWRAGYRWPSHACHQQLPERPSQRAEMVLLTWSLLFQFPSEQSPGHGQGP